MFWNCLKSLSMVVRSISYLCSTSLGNTLGFTHSVFQFLLDQIPKAVILRMKGRFQSRSWFLNRGTVVDHLTCTLLYLSCYSAAFQRDVVKLFSLSRSNSLYSNRNTKRNDSSCLLKPGPRMKYRWSPIYNNSTLWWCEYDTHSIETVI